MRAIARIRRLILVLLYGLAERVHIDVARDLQARQPTLQL